jgi:pimeloyl-ACP methyl ester carboxylesterase
MTGMRSTLACLLLAPALALAQADYAREKRLAEEIIREIVVGEPVELEVKSGRKFLAIYAPNPKATSGVVVVHGMGLHPDWGLISVLRTRLAEHRYATLSVQMPVLAADARGDEYAPLLAEADKRLAAGVAFLRSKGLKKVAIVSHSMGALMTDHFLANANGVRINAWVAIGLSGEFTAPAALKAPVLDLYGAKDYPAFVGARERAAAISKLRGSAQSKVAGADHFFWDMEDQLVRRVRLFLDSRLR